MNYMSELIQEMYEERAAIMHFEGGLPKEKAEALAKAECDTYAKHRQKVDQDKVQK